MVPSKNPIILGFNLTSDPNIFQVDIGKTGDYDSKRQLGYFNFSSGELFTHEDYGNLNLRGSDEFEKNQGNFVIYRNVSEITRTINLTIESTISTLNQTYTIAKNLEWLNSSDSDFQCFYFVSESYQLIYVFYMVEVLNQILIGDDHYQLSPSYINRTMILDLNNLDIKQNITWYPDNGFVPLEINDEHHMMYVSFKVWGDHGYYFYTPQGFEYITTIEFPISYFHDSVLDSLYDRIIKVNRNERIFTIYNYENDSFQSERIFESDLENFFNGTNTLDGTTTNDPTSQQIFSSRNLLFGFAGIIGILVSILGLYVIIRRIRP